MPLSSLNQIRLNLTPLAVTAVMLAVDRAWRAVSPSANIVIVQKEAIQSDRETSDLIRFDYDDCGIKLHLFLDVIILLVPTEQIMGLRLVSVTKGKPTEEKPSKFYYPK